MILLCVDIGNSQTKVAMFSGDSAIESWSIATSELGPDTAAWLEAGFEAAGRSPRQVKGMAVSSVVAGATEAVLAMAGEVLVSLREAPLVLTSMDAQRADIRLDIDRPEELGVDRAMNAVGAYGMFRRNMIIVDAGTALTVDAVSSQGVFLGGAILPGPSTAARSLAKETDALPLADPSRFEMQMGAADLRALGKDTDSAILSGVLFGARHSVRGLSDSMAQELGWSDYLVMLTGGAAPGLLAGPLDPSRSDNIHHEPQLTLKGILTCAQRIMP